MKVVQTFPNIYKRGTRGEVRVWRMEAGNDGDVWGHRVIAGVLDGKLVTSGWTFCEGKNIGRSNETTPKMQTSIEISANYEKKLELGYFTDVTHIDQERYTEPMLAQDYAKVKNKIDIADGVWAQPKLDGIRCIARADGLWTRKGKRIVACPHIEEALAPIFERNPDAIFDGELYNHYFADDFNKITSIVRKTKPTEADIARSKQFMLYHVYDWVSEKEFGQRIRGLRDVIGDLDSPHVQCVETVYCSKQNVLDRLYSEWMEQGYEGQMVRPDDGQHYQVGKRSRSLLKRKEFMSEEFPVLRMEEGNGNWGGAIKKFIVRLPDGTENDATPKGTYEDLSAMYQLDQCPTWATVRFFGYTPDGKLRFPVAVDWGFSDKRED